MRAILLAVTALALSVHPVSAQRRAATVGLLSTWGATVLGAAAMNDDYIGTTAIPVFGPWITISRVESGPAGYQPGGKPLLVASGALQAAFFGVLMYSLASDDSYLTVGWDTPTAAPSIRIRAP